MTSSSSSHSLRTSHLQLSHQYPTSHCCQLQSCNRGYVWRRKCFSHFKILFASSAWNFSNIAKSLTKLFNKSLRSGKFPSDWKVARVVPIPKGGDLENPANYRPISILPILSKLLEKHLHDLLSHHLKISSPLSEHQWGFTSGKSTTSALISYAHDCRKHLIVGTSCAQCFSTWAKHLILSPISLFFPNFSNSKSILSS